MRDVVHVGLRSELEAACSARGLVYESETSTLSLAYELLRRGLNEPEIIAEARIDLRESHSAIDALKAIDDLFLTRSQAHYERAFKTPVS